MTDYSSVLSYEERGKVVIVQDSAALAEAAAETMIETVAEAISAHGRAVVALSGGSTPQQMGELVAKDEYRRRIDWPRLHLFWGDERWVPLDDAESNAGEAKRTFLDSVGIPTEQVHIYRTDLSDPSTAAQDYEDQVCGFFGTEAPPRFDLIFLGMGDDGHTASLFPGTDAINEHHDWVVAHEVVKLGAVRLTFTPLVLNAGRKVVFLVAGSGKAHMLHTVLDGGVEVDLRPAQVIRPTDGELIWLADVAAAELLERQMAELG